MIDDDGRALRSDETQYRRYRRVFGARQHPASWGDYSTMGGWIRAHNKRRQPVRKPAQKKRRPS